MPDTPKPPIPHRAKKVFKGVIHDIWQWEQERFDGSTATFEAIDRPDAVQVIGIFDDKTILLVWDEQPNRAGVLTPAGGRVEKGETLKEAAAREFIEETGYTAQTLTKLHEYSPSSKMTFRVAAYIGKGLKQTTDPAPEPGERIQLRTFTFDEFLALGTNSDLRDRYLRIMLLEARLDEDKRDKLHSLLYE